jgi:hypothetical protein
MTAPALSETFAALLARSTDAELVEAEEMARLVFAETIMAVEAEFGVSFDRWLLAAVAEKYPDEIAATGRWLSTMAAWLASPRGGVPRADQIAGLAMMLEWVTETQRARAVLH